MYRLILVTLGLLLLAGCGSTAQDRALSGGGLGAAAGALGSTITGGSTIGGALLGGAAGAAAGGLTSKKQLDLGKPVWK